MRWDLLCYSKKDGGLGFRDFNIFNNALLAKQAWRLLTNEQSLVARLLKARYFPHCSFLSSSLGSLPSFSWRSIWGAKETLGRGVRWRIGNGKSVDIWKEKWLPTPTSFKVTSPRQILNEGALVSDLIDAEKKEWRKSLVNSIFLPHEAAIICQIPLSNRLPDDRPMWHYHPKGFFTVRSAYLMEMDTLRRQRSDITGEGSSGDGNAVGAFVWSQPVPNKVKHFVWRAVKGILPTIVSLTRRHISVDLICPMCRQDEETIIHVLKVCPVACLTW
ncbi:hypothetical protein L1049_026449 [Liquidambar formosana]|uniref:Reverse transcriptase zinc-binding domain-containing protein n=1 Tax=Liquidambar formosana TaxID=63359 RepID=A0AAP0NDP7_LIQFO